MLLHSLEIRVESFPKRARREELPSRGAFFYLATFLGIIVVWKKNDIHLIHNVVGVLCTTLHSLSATIIIVA